MVLFRRSPKIVRHLKNSFQKIVKFNEDLRHCSGVVSQVIDTNHPIQGKADPIRVEDLPGPLALPVVGAGYKLIFNRNARSSMHLTQLDLVNQYGNIFNMALGPERGIAIACPELMEEIVKHEDPIPVRKEPLPWAEYLKSSGVPTGLLTSQYDDWDRKRKAVRSSMLKPYSMQNMVGSLEKISEDFTEVIVRKRNHTNYIPHLPNELYYWAFEGIVSVLFGVRAGCLDNVVNNQAHTFIQGLNEILDACFNSLMIFAPIHRRFSTNLWVKHKQAWDTINQAVKCHGDKLLSQLDSVNPESAPLLLQLMGNNKLTNEDIESLMAEFFMGGVDTTSNSAGFALYCLACHPDKQRKLREEIETVIGNDDITLQAINQMTYLRNCIKETLRLYPILQINGRKIKEDFVSNIGNIHFKANDNVLFFHYAMCRSSELWYKPNAFIPERFDRAHSTPQSSERKFISIPFGFGTRACIGKRIAEAELSMLLIKLISKFDLRIDNKVKFEPKARSVLTPGEHIPVQFVDRSN